MGCPIVENLHHFLACDVLRNELGKYGEKVESVEVNYMYSSLQNQLKLAKFAYKLSEVRDSLLNC